MFITFEGIDGSGKSTQARKFYQYLKEHNTAATLTREPGGSTGGEVIRKLLVEGDKTQWSAETEILLFSAARRDHLETLILPALEKGDIVISDRFIDSTRIYQSAIRAELRQKIDIIHQEMIAHEADLVFIFDLDPKKAFERALKRHSHENRFETFGLQFQETVRAGFLNLAQEHHRYHIIDASGDEDSVFTQVKTLFQEKYGAHFE